MQLVEIRDLDGPNVFLLRPAIKLELEVGRRDLTREALGEIRVRFEPLGISDESRSGGVGTLSELFSDAVRTMHQRAGVEAPEVVWRPLEAEDHYVLAFEWTRRRFARRVAEIAAGFGLGEICDVDSAVSELTLLLATPAEAADIPEMVADAERQVPIIGITGTNGKTTTTRLCAHILREAGRSVGWSSSSGVYIDGEQVLSGDYTGPSGARRVLQEPGLDVAVLETARGGILLRGVAYESNDVSVFTNVSADHLDMLGIRTIDGLTAVKSTVVRVTRPGGYAVLNADDSLVRGCAGGLRATPVLVSRRDDNTAVRNHVLAGGTALFVRDGALIYRRRGGEEQITTVAEIPVTYSGRAGHMLENAICAAAACLALGLSPNEVKAGLSTFRNTPELNPGRLHVYDVLGTTVVVDYAHNEAGLKHLLEFGKTYLGEDGRTVSVIGTAGDRSDEALREIGRLAGEQSDEVVIKETARYLRGRESAREMTQLLARGVESAEHAAWSEAASELAGVEQALVGRRAGDVVVVMCIEQMDEVRSLLAQAGHLVS